MVNGPTIDVHVTGIAELDAFLKNLEVNVAKRGTRVATKKVAEMVVVEAKRIAPVKTGALRDTIKVGKKAKDRKYGDAEAGHSVTVGSGLFKGDQFYAGMLEFGTKPRYHKKRIKQTAIREAWHGKKYERGKYVGSIDENKWQFIRRALYSDRAAKHAVFVAEIKRWIEQQKRKAFRMSAEQVALRKAKKVAKIERRINRYISKKQKIVSKKVKQFKKVYIPKKPRRRVTK